MKAQVAVRGKLEPLRAKATKCGDRGWLYKWPDGKFTARLESRRTGGSKGLAGGPPGGS
ncbi:hypothetical protein [Streptomyces sp. NBC_00347]|uniref:hypothetical protein n=1 Tax=Streptomyces sp. NBC_00347 TaxID=2975721 RepID=UPI002252E28F|nr:hypothetical protein [Streptomyces sp. NBC_00347]MCX5129459.1 hypothetical protein [Streptomyces sp. NBC_00347]